MPNDVPVTYMRGTWVVRRRTILPTDVRGFLWRVDREKYDVTCTEGKPGACISPRRDSGLVVSITLREKHVSRMAEPMYRVRIIHPKKKRNGPVRAEILDNLTQDQFQALKLSFSTQWGKKKRKFQCEEPNSDDSTNTYTFRALARRRSKKP